MTYTNRICRVLLYVLGIFTFIPIVVVVFYYSLLLIVGVAFSDSPNSGTAITGTIIKLIIIPLVLVLPFLLCRKLYNQNRFIISIIFEILSICILPVLYIIGS